MANALTDIQQALETIRIASEKETVVVPRTQVVKRYVNMPSTDTKTANDTGQAQHGTNTNTAKEPLVN